MILKITPKCIRLFVEPISTLPQIFIKVQLVHPRITHNPADSQRDRHTAKHTDRHTGRQTDRQNNSDESITCSFADVVTSTWLYIISTLLTMSISGINFSD